MATNITIPEEITAAILSTLVVSNKESIEKYCVPKIMAILREKAGEVWDAAEKRKRWEISTIKSNSPEPPDKETTINNLFNEKK